MFTLEQVKNDETILKRILYFYNSTKKSQEEYRKLNSDKIKEKQKE